MWVWRHSLSVRVPSSRTKTERNGGDGLFDVYSGNGARNHQTLNLAGAFEDGVNLGVTVASPYRLGFRKFYCAKVTQTASEPVRKIALAFL